MAGKAQQLQLLLSIVQGFSNLLFSQGSSPMTIIPGVLTVDVLCESHDLQNSEEPICSCQQPYQVCLLGTPCQGGNMVPGPERNTSQPQTLNKEDWNFLRSPFWVERIWFWHFSLAVFCLCTENSVFLPILDTVVNNLRIWLHFKKYFIRANLCLWHDLCHG